MTPPRPRHARSRIVLLTLLALAALGSASTAAADTADETALAERYAPVVRLVEQVEECGPGEAYEPMDVDALFDEPTVALRGPWGGGDLVEIAPSARDLGDRLYEYHLDFPGDALDPECDYELLGTARHLGSRADGLRTRRHRSGSSRPARTPVLAVLCLQ